MGVGSQVLVLVSSCVIVFVAHHFIKLALISNIYRKPWHQRIGTADSD